MLSYIKALDQEWKKSQLGFNNFCIFSDGAFIDPTVTRVIYAIPNFVGGAVRHDKVAVLPDPWNSSS